MKGSLLINCQFVVLLAPQEVQLSVAVTVPPSLFTQPVAFLYPPTVAEVKLEALPVNVSMLRGDKATGTKPADGFFTSE